MRPKKRVLLYCADELRASQVGFVLRTRRYAVEQADCLAHLGHLLDWSPMFDAALLLATAGVDPEPAVRMLRAHATQVPVLLQPAKLTTAVTLAHRALAPGAGMDDMVEAVRVACARQRGPKPLHGADALRAKAKRAAPIPHADAELVVVA